jgi:hypothetical protein
MKEKNLAIIITLSVLALALYGFFNLVAWIWRGVF